MGATPRTVDRGTVKLVAKVLDPGEEVWAYSRGRVAFKRNWYPVLAVAVIIGIFVVALVTGYYIVPAVLLGLSVAGSAQLLRGVAVTDQGVVVCSLGSGAGRPEQVLHRAPRGQGVVMSDGGRVLEVAGEPIKLARRSFRSVRAALARHHATLAAPPAGWYPDPWDARALRYWDGGSWTAHVGAAGAAFGGAAYQG